MTADVDAAFAAGQPEPEGAVADAGPPPTDSPEPAGPTGPAAPAGSGGSGGSGGRFRALKSLAARAAGRGRTWWLDSSVILACVAVYASTGYSRRWVTDDGLIFLRPVRQILAGHGPVFNSGERVETSTSTLWQWILTFVAWATGSHWDLGLEAVYLGLLLAVCGVLVALDATRRLVRSVSGGGRAPLVPVGILAVLVIPSFWDFATSGLETGLEMFWIGSSWALLVHAYLRTRSGRLGRRMLLGTAVWFGLGPLVRPDLGLTSAVFLAVLLVLVRARRLKAAAVVGVTAALPLGYEIFRMGYYGLVVPMPGVTKEASSNLWRRGLIYFTDFAEPYALWLPAVLAVALFAVAAWRIRPSRALGLVVAAPVVSGLLQGGYVLKVGGDFMHGRMWVPVVVLCLLPLMLVPLSKLTAPAIVGFAAWAALGVVDFRTARDGTCKRGPVAFCWVWNERTVYVAWTGVANPDRTSLHLRSPRDAPLRALVGDALDSGSREMVFDPHYITQPAVPLAPGKGGSVGVVIGTLGAGGLLTPLDGTVIDVWGLGNTIGAHIDIPSRGAAGHEKLLPEVWNLALYADPADDAQTLAALPRSAGVTAARLAAARHVLQCGQVKELLDSISQPMTVGRFWDNLTGSLDRTTLRIPADPIAAEQEFCR